MKIDVIKKKLKRKNKLIIGCNSIGRKMLIINLSKKEFISFKKFCNKNNYKFKILNSENEYVISCEKIVYQLFNKEVVLFPK